MTYGFPGIAATGTTIKASDGMVISFNGGRAWNTATYGGDTFLGALVHELLHTLGLSHPWNCGEFCAEGEAPCSAVGTDVGNAAEGQNLYLNDLLGLRAIYGSVDRFADDHFVNTDHTGLDWTELGGSLPPVLPLFEVSGSPDVTDMFMGGRSPTNLEPVAYHWDQSTTTWTRWGEELFLYSHVGRVAAAWNHHSGVGYIGHQRGETVTIVRKALEWTILTSPTTFWTLTTGSETRRPGVALAYQGLDDITIYASRNDIGQIEIHWIEPGAVYSGPYPLFDDSGEPIYAYDTPSVACAEVPDAGLFYHCVLAWAASDNTHTLRWMHFGIHPTGPSGSLEIYLDTICGDSWLLDSAPRVTYRGAPDGPAAWMVGWTSQYDIGHMVTTMGKPLREEEGWDPRTGMEHRVYPVQVSIDLGAATDSAQLLVTN